MAQLAYAALAGIFAYLLVFLLFPALALPAYPWALLIGVLVAIVVYFSTRRRI